MENSTRRVQPPKLPVKMQQQSEIDKQAMATTKSKERIQRQNYD